MMHIDNLNLLAPAMSAPAFVAIPWRRELLYIGLYVLLSGALVFFFFLEPSYLSYRNVPFEVVKEPRAGEPVHLRVHRCSSSSTKEVYTLARELIPLDGQNGGHPIVMKAEDVQIRPGCHDQTSQANVVPATAGPGRWLIDATAITEGTVRKAKVNWRSQPFRVHPASAPEG